jgi:hypothetical protein
MGRFYKPHLTLDESNPLENGILGIPNGNRMWTPGIVASPMDISIPNLSISINCSITMTLEVYILASKEPRRRLVLVANGKRIVEPVRNVRAPLKSQSSALDE